MAFTRPGVFVEEAALPSVSENEVGANTAVLLSEHHRGPTEPTPVTSWTDYRSKFGSFGEGDLSFAAFQFFQNGGGSLWIKRVEGTGGAIASRTLNDRAGTPIQTLQVDALNSGAWGNAIYIEIADGSASGQFNLSVYDGGTTSADRVERWIDLTMDDASDRHVEKVINHPTSGSTYVTVTDLDSGTSSPDDTPAVQTATALTGGSDGTVATTDITDALPELDVITDSFTLNLPNMQDGTVLGEAITYAEGRGDVLVVIDPAFDDTVAEVITFADALTSSSYAAVYYPHVYFKDPSSNEANAIRLLPPGGAVLGKIAATDAARGVHKSPAGLDTRLVGASALPQRFTPTDLDSLNQSHVNAIRNVPGSGIVIMGARTLSTNLLDRHLSVRRTLIDVKSAAKDLTQFAVFEPNDQNLWATIKARLEQYLRGLWQQGALRGTTEAEAFFVKCDAEINTEQVILAGEVRVEIGVAAQRPAEFVIIRVGQWQGGQSADETV